MPLIIESNEAYHASEGVSKTKVWAMETVTPYKAMFGKHKDSHAFDLGTAAHVAILEPHRFDRDVLRGPSDRRGNKWKDAQIEAEATGATLLTESDHDLCQVMRDVAAGCSVLQMLLRGAVIERSGYATDEETGLAVKTRPDIWNPAICIIADLKSMSDISPDSWCKSVASFGYHVQDAMYSDVWQKAAGAEVNGFMFVCVSKDDPPEITCYELDADAKREGFLRYRRGLEKYAACKAAKQWPSYSADVQTTSLPKWAFQLTQPEGNL